MTSVRDATPGDLDGMLELMPRLAAFDLPESRVAEHLWMHDAELLKAWAAGDADNCFACVAEVDGRIVGVAAGTERPELLSRAPSAHLEAIAVAAGMEGLGVGARLLDHIEKEAVRRGALTITLHVFANNRGARGFYEHKGYDGELMRYTKPLA